jgi:hypothetical protein
MPVMTAIEMAVFDATAAQDHRRKAASVMRFPLAATAAAGPAV